MKILDLSFNSICSSVKAKFEDEEEDPKKKKKVNKKASNNNSDLGILGIAGGMGFYEEFAEKWSRMFAKNKSLVHVDLSHNKIKVDDCEIIAEGLKSNHTVLGLHF